MHTDCLLDEKDKIENRIKLNEIIIDIYKNVDCVFNRVLSARLENIELRQRLQTIKTLKDGEAE